MPHLQIQNGENRQNPALEEFHILRTSSDKEFSELLFLCAQSVEATVAALIVIENGKSWVKASYGAPPEEVRNEVELWKRILEQDGIIIFNQKELMELGRDYSGFIGLPLATTSEEKLGIIAIFDPKVTEITPAQKRCLKILKDQILNVVVFKKQNNQYQRIQKDLEQRYQDLEKFASVVSHDIKSPLANIISLVELLKEEIGENFNEETRQYIEFLSQASHSLRSYVDGLLVFYRSERILEKEGEDVELKAFFDNLTNLYTVDPQVEIIYPLSGRLKNVNKAALTQIFMNLISNALKYNDKEKRRVEIKFKPIAAFYEFQVIDNGNGIPAAHFNKIFELFTTLDLNDRDGNPGSGIGLATVKKMLIHMGGDIKIESEPGTGSNFRFQIKRSC